MDVSSGNLTKPVRKRNDKGRRSWSRGEEETLVAAQKEVIANGWKSENGFKIGYLQALEHEMQKMIPGTDLKGIPHINSKIYVWKKDYGSLVMMSTRSGIGWNVDANARLLRNKSWSFYNNWVMIFGKDRATGEHAEDFTEALNHVLNGTSIPQDDYPVNLENLSDNCEYETETSFVCQVESTPQTSALGKKGTGHKRKSIDGIDPLYEIMKTFCQSTDARLGDIAKRIGYEYDISLARKEAFGVVGNIQGLSLHDKLLISKLFVKNTEDLELFFSLPDEARTEFARMKLAGNL
ncbi:hypothetical protein DH2020_041739 [Rehmannia glutinosa]|uniref:Myb/SANT-like domain-containing protein n=1 Tax=Rehmannia glutinosa TaxID=99300 RepID=A0ABR0URE7_REHGL